MTKLFLEAIKTLCCVAILASSVVNLGFAFGQSVVGVDMSSNQDKGSKSIVTCKDSNGRPSRCTLGNSQGDCKYGYTKKPSGKRVCCRSGQSGCIKSPVSSN